MHRELVEHRRWVSENQFLRVLNFCMLLPALGAQQLATYSGWRLHGTRGGLVAGSFFIIPSVFALLLATTSFVLLQRFKVSIYLTVLTDAVAGMV